MVCFKRNVDELDGVRVARVAAAGQTLDLERNLPMLRNWTLTIEGADSAPDHHPDDRVNVGFGDAARGDVMTVAQHGVAIAEAKNLVEPMRDKDNRQAFGLQRQHDADEIGDFGFAQGGGRLVHDNEPGLHGEGASNLDEL